MSQMDWAKARSILVVHFGDSAEVPECALALAAVADGRPDRRLTLLIGPEGRSAAGLLPCVADVIIWSLDWENRGEVSDLVEKLRSKNFDAAIVLSASGQSPHPGGYLCFLAEIPLRAGASLEFGGGLFSSELRPFPGQVRSLDRHLALLRAIGLSDSDEVDSKLKRRPLEGKTSSG